MNADFPAKLQCLFEPHRYKVLYGGRGGAKSWGIARALLILGAQRKLRIMCAREIQKSISESVLKLLEEQITALGLAGHYTVQKTAIIGKNGTTFLFAGLKHNIASLKSVEGCDIVWVEEAAGVSRDSWATLIPTVRKDGSEIWISFNPELDSDDTYKRFVLNPPPGAACVPVSWRDNPWFPEVLRIEKDHLEATDPAAHKQVWEGATRSACEGAIYAAEIAEAEKEGRIGSVPRDRSRPVDTYWDLGFGDCTAIWFGQSMPDGTFRVIDYLENTGKTIEWYMIQLQQKGYLYGIDWLPHDGVDLIIHKKLGADPTRSIERLMRNAGRKVRIAPKMHVSTGINSARTIFGQCWFDREKCADGLQALRHYQWMPITSGGVESKTPKHDFASHGADAFRTMAYAIKSPEKPPPPPSPMAPGAEYSWMG
jgi:phage terminase large subunit